ncbi:MAG TPA: hypothetical protein VHG93_02710 [Longimicrobium sp.]|nr:hypothetical protein [Longimicrobium sp.]
MRTIVVERCPACGVEHDHPTGGACEACDTAVRMWCRAHSREIGWLEGLACPRCAEEAARARPVPAPRSIPRTSAPAATQGTRGVARARPPADDETLAGLWRQALGQVVGKTAIAGGGGGIAGGIVTLFMGGNALAEALDAAILFGVAGLSIGSILGVAILIDGRTRDGA